MLKELVSIVLPVYNGQDYLQMCIESCLNQTYRNIELIIINDASTDDSLDIINSMINTNDHRIKLINNATNMQLPISLNLGHSMARGRYITWISHDNLFHTNAIYEMVRTIQKSEADIVFCNYETINKSGKIIDRINLPDIDNIFFKNVIGCCFLYTRDVFEKLKGYRIKYFLVEDYDFWLRALKYFNFFHYQKILYRYRIHDKSLTSSYLISDFREQQFKKI